MDPLKHMGYPDCFWDILERCPKADFYAFSDQDDISFRFLSKEVQLNIGND